MRLKKWITIIFVLITCSAKSQIAEEVNKLENIIRYYFEKSRDPFKLEEIGNLGGPSEAIFVTLEIDSTGSVEGIHLFTDNDKDSGYSIISNLKALNFKSWKEEKYKGKTILIPVVILNKSQRPIYIRDLADLTVSRKEVRNLVVGKPVVLGWPTIIRHETISSQILK